MIPVNNHQQALEAGGKARYCRKWNK